MIRVPVYGILCDGENFEFFQFDSSTTPPSFRHGYTTGFITCPQLPRLTGHITCPFIVALRPICEIVFDLMLTGYISSLEAHHNRAVMNSPKAAVKWRQAIISAHKAQGNFRDAETKRQMQLIDAANAAAQEAMDALKHRYDYLTCTHCI